MTYSLRIVLDRDIKTHVGSLGDLHFKKGAYLYVGSAKRGLKARLERHLVKKKKIFWHIDYLLSSRHAQIKDIWINIKKKECQTASKLYIMNCCFVNKFGSSDCCCPSHLFFIGKSSLVEELSKKEGFRKLSLK
jgi:sugar fermentation stimulation protein A